MKKIITSIIIVIGFASVKGQITPTNYSLSQNWVVNHNLNKRINFNPSYTIIKPDTTQRTVVNIPYDTLSNYDVFCIYPTIPTGGGGTPQIHPLAFDATTVTPLIVDLYSQYAEFGRIYAPYYRQINGVTFISPGSMNTQARLLDTAVTDVIAAFEYYFNNYNGGKKIILVGHSQGSVLLGMMLRKFESNPTLYSAFMNKIVLSVLPGFVTGPHTLNSSNTGGWFQNYPICQNPNDINCMMTWQTYKSTATLGTPSASNHIYNDSIVSFGYRYKDFDTINYQILNDPLYFSSIDTISLTKFPNSILGYGGITTHYVAYENYFKAYTQQVSTDYGLKVQKIFVMSDDRINPIPTLTTFYHVYDHYIASGSVIDIIRNKISLTTSIENLTINQNALTVFPNPTSGNIHVNIIGQQLLNIKIYNLTGELVQEHFTTEFSIANLQSGLYFLITQTDKGYFMNKLIKQ